jgi:hypothetical protein
MNPKAIVAVPTLTIGLILKGMRHAARATGAIL